MFLSVCGMPIIHRFVCIYLQIDKPLIFLSLFSLSPCFNFVGCGVSRNDVRSLYMYYVLQYNLSISGTYERKFLTRESCIQRQKLDLWNWSNQRDTTNMINLGVYSSLMCFFAKCFFVLNFLLANFIFADDHVDERVKWRFRIT